MKIFSLLSILIGSSDTKLTDGGIAHHKNILSDRDLSSIIPARLEYAAAARNPLPNPRFIFHNKIPKCGSTTMANILAALETTNNFNLIHYHPCIKSPCDKSLDGRKNSDYLTQELAPEVEEATADRPLVLVKHHHFTNFTAYEMEMPTMINVARDPVNRFVSSFYFRRFGFNRNEGVRREFIGKKKQEMGLEECVMNEAHECSEAGSNQAFLEYICGSDKLWPECGNISNPKSRERALERAKKHVLNEYLAIGILEDIENTLTLFERMVPTVFHGAPAVYRAIGETITNQTSTAKKEPVSDLVREKLEKGPLRHQVDLYNLIKAVYEQKLRDFGISK